MSEILAPRYILARTRGFHNTTQKKLKWPLPAEGQGPFRRCCYTTAIEFTSSGMPGPNVVETEPFWM